MYTKEDFQEAIKNTIAKYPTLAPLYHAGDPRVHQPLDAIATMLAMLSAQLETAQTEQYEKARDGTILADAAMRGILPKGTPARAQITVTNNNTEDFTVSSGRTLIDSNGLLWYTETSRTIPAGESDTIEATQRYFVTQTHTVEGSEPFYSIGVPASDDDAYLCSIAVADGDGLLEYRDHYVNATAGERIFHVEADDRQKIYVRLGYDGVVGVQPADGDELTLTVGYTAGAVTCTYGSPFAFETMQDPLESLVTMTMDQQLSAGADPISMSTMRDLAKYPSTYRTQAVFLGEFGLLVRANFPDLAFLSIWNERIEENARGASVENVNTLFVAVKSATGDEVVFEDKTAPVPVLEGFLTETQEAIKECIQEADNSYRVQFVTPIIQKISMTITATVPGSYSLSSIKAQIREAILEKYGQDSEAAQKGQNVPLKREVYSLLLEKITALSDGESDVDVEISGVSRSTVRPELWCFVDDDSLTVTVTQSSMVKRTWGG